MNSLNNVNEEVSSDTKDEVETMISEVPKLSYAVSHYASHCLRANMQFSAIEKNIQSMKKYLSIIYMVPDHNFVVYEISGGTG